MRTLPAALVALVVATAGCASAESDSGTDVTAPSLSASASGSASASATPTTTATTSATAPRATTTTATTSTTTRPPTRRTTVAEGLDVPWGLAFLPDGSALLTTRDEAQLYQVREGAPPVRLGTIAGVVPGGEGGLLGVTASPDFASDQTVYLYFTAGDDNRVVRLTFAGGKAGAPKPVLTGIPKARNHNGGRIAFGPDGYLYVATGDAGDGSAAQDRSSLAGKILRVTRDGKPAPGNPFQGSPVWSYGHRNVQGLAWDGTGRLFASEFGQNTWDELNLIRPGANYGWPEVEGSGGQARFVDPLRQWATSDSSPSGIAVTADGTVYMAALRGESLWRVPFRGGQAGEPQRLLNGEYGRLRDVVVGPDGRLWVITNNTARGTPREGDDRVIVIPEATLR
jgi:glucose/arabinose dehydrogenase